MLVLQRTPGEQIHIGDNMTLTLGIIARGRKQVTVEIDFHDTGMVTMPTLNQHEPVSLTKDVSICLTKSSTLSAWIGIAAPRHITILRAEVEPRDIYNVPIPVPEE